MEQRLILFNLLFKLGVAAAVSSSLVRSKEFKSLLFREERTFQQKLYLVLWFGLPIMVGVWARIFSKSFQAGDMSFETALLLGVIGGRWAGSLGGVLMAIPALLHGEWAAMPFDVLSGFLAGQLRTWAVDKDDIWSFSPFIDESIFRIIRRNLPRPRLFDWQIMVFSQANCAPGRSIRMISGRSRRSSMKASSASSGAIYRARACSTGRSCFSRRPIAHLGGR